MRVVLPPRPHASFDLFSADSLYFSTKTGFRIRENCLNCRPHDEIQICLLPSLLRVLQPIWLRRSETRRRRWTSMFEAGFRNSIVSTVEATCGANWSCERRFEITPRRPATGYSPRRVQREKRSNRHKNGGAEAPPGAPQSKADICAAAALRSSVWPGLSTGRSKGFQASPTICS